MIYPTAARAEEVRGRLIELQKAYLTALDDAVVANLADSGSIRLEKFVHADADGAISDSFWGLLIGALFLGPLCMASDGLPGPYARALADAGLSGSFKRKLIAKLRPGTGALFLLFKLMTTDRLLKEIKSFGGVVLKTSLDENKGQALRDALSNAAERGR
ncbi:DUF1269 domain-containing protein [Rhizobium sp. RAF56]|uniref:DUF1269 domain-containing protein n=1 Tax=Rhizobium sp. RAF56 TaxID=3233062 RepID=UPI003F9B47C7